jgi:hypothetical protein
MRFRCPVDPSADQLAAYARLAAVDRENFMRALPGERNRRGKEAGHGFLPHTSARKGEDFW